MINLNIYMYGFVLILMASCQNPKSDTPKEAVLQEQVKSTQMKYTNKQDQKDTSEINPHIPVEYRLIIDSASQTLPLQRYPNSKENLEDILKAFKNNDTLKIVCYGNSITNGYKVGTSGRVANPYPETLEKLLQKYYKNPHISIINQGHNGWRSSEALQNVERLVIREKPDLVILKFGINDVYSSLSPTRFGQNMQQLITLIKNKDIKILLLLPTPIQTKYEVKVQQYAPVLKKITEDENIAFFDLHTAILERINQENITLGQLLPDDVHLAEGYYAWIAEEILDFLK